LERAWQGKNGVPVIRQTHGRQIGKGQASRIINMKYQFQFSGANVSRPANQPRRHLLWGAFLGIVMLAGLGCWQYFSYLNTGTFLFFKRAAVAPIIAAAVPPATQTLVAPESSAQMPPALKEAANDAIESAWTHLVSSVKAPAMPATEIISAPSTRTMPSAPPAQTVAVQATPLSVPIVATPIRPKTNKTKPPETPEQRLQRAGQAAFNSMLDQATKYPDAYGFMPEDIFTETTLGAAMPVYTIAEKDRHAYQNGQPVGPLLKSANQWVFPVYAGQRLCCMVQISYNGRDYVPGKSSKFLAMAWTKIAERWPVSEGYHPHLIVNPAIPGFYFTIPEVEMPNVTDMFQMFYINPSLSPADVILASWR
jgi:hypothetical protein